MRLMRITAGVLSGVLVSGLFACTTTGETPMPTNSDPSDGPERTVRRLYELISFEPGTTPDWEAVRSLFLPESVVVLRTSRDELTTFTLDGFVQDFVDFITSTRADEVGFTERILGLETFVYGDIAHVLVVFDSHLGGSSRPPSEGLDSIQLVRRDGQWLVAAITNERPVTAGEIPAHLFERQD